MEKKENRGARPGENRGKGRQGRKAHERGMVIKTVRLYLDQANLTNSEIRDACDDWLKKQNGE